MLDKETICKYIIVSHNFLLNMSNSRGVNIISFALTSDLHVKLAILYVKIPDTLQWDVIQSCNRDGSLDSNIQNEVPNNLPDLLKQFPNIKIICLNGNKAYTAFKKYFPD